MIDLKGIVTTRSIQALLHHTWSATQTVMHIKLKYKNKKSTYIQKVITLTHVYTQ